MEITMKELSKILLIFIVSLCLWACDNKEDEPEIPLEVLPQDMEVLKNIHRELGVDEADYPARWDPEDKNTWGNAGIELDTIMDETTQTKYLVISSITVYLHHVGSRIPGWLGYLNNLTDLKIYGCSGSLLYGERIPSTVKSLLVDRLNSDDPGYIIGVPFEGDKIILGNRAVFASLIMHGVDMKNIEFKFQFNSQIDLSNNTLEGAVPYNWGLLMTPANLSYNRYIGLENGWKDWTPNGMTIPNVQHNLIEYIPQDVLKSDFWKKYHESFIVNPGYVAPEP